MSLLFAKQRWSYAQSSSPDFDNKVVQEIIINDQEFCSLEDNDQQVILVRHNSSAPIIRTGFVKRFSPKPRVNRPAGATGLKPVRGFRTPRGLVTSKSATGAQRKLTRLGRGSNPSSAGGGSGTNWDDGVPKVPGIREDSHHDFRLHLQKKKKQEAQQCELNEDIPYKINEKFESNDVKKLVKTVLDNQRVKQEYQGIKKRLKEGLNPIDIGKDSTRVSSNKVLIKVGHGRYLVEISGNQVNVLGIGARVNAKNMNNFRDLMNKKYGLNLQY